MLDNNEHNGVICKRCAAPVVVHAPEKVAEEFTVVCQKCGHRGFYRIKYIRTINSH